MPYRTGVVALMAGGLLGCGKPVEAGPDPTILPPVIPWLTAGQPDVATPQFACLPGWRPVETDGVSACDPWPDEGRQTCVDDHTAHIPGSPACASVGESCSPSGWPADLPTTNVWYVDAAAPSGTGAETSPFAAIQTAVDAASPGDTIAIAAGDYLGKIYIDKDLSLVGACPEQTRITAVCGDGDAVIASAGVAVSLHDLTVHDADCEGIVADGGSLELRGVAVVRVRKNGIVAESDLDADHIVVQGTRGQQSDDGFGRGLYAPGSGTVTIRNSEFRQNRRFGVSISNGSGLATVENSAIVDVAADAAEGRLGAGLNLLNQPAASVQGLYVEGSRGEAIAHWDSGDLSVDGFVVVGIAADEFDRATGLLSVTSGVVEARSVWVRDNPGIGVWIDRAERTSLQDVLVQRTVPVGNGLGAGVVLNDTTGTIRRIALLDVSGDGLYLVGSTATVEDARTRIPAFYGGIGAGVFAVGSDVTMDRVIIEDGVVLGIGVSEGGSMDMRDVAIRRVPGDTSANQDGFGLVADAAVVTAQRLLVEDSAATAVSNQNGSTMSLTDLVIRNLRLSVSVDNGVGFNLSDTSEATIERADISGTTNAGIFAQDQSVTTVIDVHIRDVNSATSGVAGDGMSAWDDASIAGRSVSVSGARYTGLRTEDQGKIVLSDVLVTATRPMACAETSCAQYNQSYGVVAGGGNIALERFVLRDNGEAGAVTTGPGRVSLSAGHVSGHQIAVQGDVTLIEVALQDNEQDVVDAPAPPLTTY